MSEDVVAEREGQGSVHVLIVASVRIQERKRVNWSDVCIDRGPLGYIYEYKRR